jgi:hypothetical protein
MLIQSGGLWKYGASGPYPGAQEPTPVTKNSALLNIELYGGGLIVLC